MNLSIVSAVNDLSYGIVGTNLVHQGLISGHNISLFPINEKLSTSQKLAPYIQKAIENSKMFDFNAPCVRIWHQNNMSLFSGRGSRVGFPIFELDTFSNIEIHHLKNCDRLFVCSEWAKQVIENNGIKVPTQVVPLGVDPTIFNVKHEPLENTVFLNVGKLEVRKGHDIIPELFRKAFPEETNVELWMSNYNIHYSPDDNNKWFNMYKRMLGDRVKIFPRFNTQEEVAKVMQHVDCGLFPSRAEGWNLEVLELMACGKKSIVLNYSALTEYCNKDNSYLVSVEEKEKAIDGIWFNGSGNWAKIGPNQEEQIIEYMRAIHKKKQEGVSSFSSDCVQTAELFTWKESIKKLINNLE